MTYKKGTRVELKEDYVIVASSHIQGELSVHSEGRPLIIPEGERGIADDEWYNLNTDFGNGPEYTDVEFDNYGAKSVPDIKLKKVSDP
jgi:type IV secretory pathway protease TraF